MNIEMIPLDAIEVGQRIRALNDAYVNEIAASFEEKGGEGTGQINPIEVRTPRKGRYQLISGAHRLAAAQKLGWSAIAAQVIEVDNNGARLREIDENLVRHDLTAFDRALFIRQRQEIWLKTARVVGRAISAHVRWHGNATEIFSFKADAAAKLGVTEKTIGDWIKLAAVIDNLDPEVRARVAEIDLANQQTELKLLAAEEPERQREVLDLLLSDEKDAPRKVRAAVKRLNGVEEEHVSKADKRFQDFQKLWARCDGQTKDRIAQYVRRELD